MNLNANYGVDLNASYRSNRVKPQLSDEEPVRAAIASAQASLHSLSPGDDVIIKGGARHERHLLGQQHILKSDREGLLIYGREWDFGPSDGDPSGEEMTKFGERVEAWAINNPAVLLDGPENFPAAFQESLARTVEKYPDAQFVAVVDSDKKMTPALNKALGGEKSVLDLGVSPERHWWRTR